MDINKNVSKFQDDLMDLVDDKEEIKESKPQDVEMEVDQPPMKFNGNVEYDEDMPQEMNAMGTRPQGPIMPG